VSIGPVVVKGIDLTTIQGRRVVARALLRANSRPRPARVLVAALHAATHDGRQVNHGGWGNLQRGTLADPDCPQIWSYSKIQSTEYVLFGSM